ncbi:phage tail protein [Burkholderia alba]|uniref:phage tail protein n=1 Tax=Burkholderia alba TaxID=2683677 RepID=UPI002B056DE9|nr:phage tail protein [Burkholderia alba]
MSLVDIQIDAQGLERIAIDLQATERQVRQALASTLSKMGRWLRGRAIAGLSKELGIKRQILQLRRLKMRPVLRGANGSQISIFFGLDPIAYIYLGEPQKTAKGVSVGRFYIEGGFVAKAPNGKKFVFKRKGNARLPIEKQALDIKDKADTFIEDRLLVEPAFFDRFFQIFEHELKWRRSQQST